MLRPLAVAVAAGLALALAGCADGGAAGDTAGGARVLSVFAAASLTDAFSEIGEVFSSSSPTSSPGVEVRFNFGPSSGLLTQLLEGAPADVYASADEATMDEARAGGAVAERPTAFARNVLALAVPAGNPVRVRGLADLARDELLVGLCAAEVPCGRLARQLLDREAVRVAPDTEEPDVRSLLTKIEAGELDAGLVYRSDVRAGGARVEGIEVPESEEVGTTYPVAPVARAAEPELARAFVAFVVSGEGRRILADHGFLAP
ncbi:MAG: molybdate ABC transporter substrate-binding protein [Actinomycetota bacterium]|nr:molybdate ABC transporter substrate-binding protein [Actinomycetota bacterium]